jgi:hypothetical protein
MLLRQRSKKNMEEHNESSTVILEDQFKQLQEKYNQFEHDQQNWSETIQKTIQEQFIKSIQEQQLLQITLHKSFEFDTNNKNNFNKAGYIEYKCVLFKYFINNL